MTEANYLAELHAEQNRIRLTRERVYTRTEPRFVLNEEEREWLAAVEYKILRIKNHTRVKAKAMDDLIDAANYIGLLFHLWWAEGHRPTTSEELVAAEQESRNP